MALNLPNRYPLRFAAPTADYPQGSFKNRSAPGAFDGSYLEKDWANDKEGFFQSLIAAAGIVPNEIVDKVGASQYFDALQQVIADGLVVPDASETEKGIIEIATSAEAQAGADTVRAVTPAGLLAALNALTLGRGQTWQDVKSSRLVNTVYQNTTGRPIEWSLSGGGPVAIGGTPMMQVSSNGVNWVTVASYSDDAANQGSAVIPPLWYYRTQNINLVVHWAELR